MRSVLWLALLAAGCDLVYGLDGRIDPDAAEIDAPDAPPGIDSSIPCTNYSATVTAVADTMLMRDGGGECNPSIRLGTYINVNLGQAASANTRSRVLLQFTLPPELIAALEPGGGFTEATLTLPLKPNACSGPCASTPLDFSVYAANNDWNEGAPSGNIGAAWCARKQVAPAVQERWTVEGADGTEDRSMTPLGIFSVTAAQAMQNQVAFTTTPSPATIDDVRSWVRTAQLSLLLVPTSASGTLFIKAREDAANGGGARLTIKSCR